MKIKPMAIVLMMLAGWVNRQQTEVIEYLLEENKILREKFGKKRILLDILLKIRLSGVAEQIMCCYMGNPS